jgi:uncharacterized membrane protein YfcA
MNVSKPIGYVLIAIGVIGIIMGISMMTSLPDNPFAILFGIGFIIVALIILGIGAIAAKK